MTRSLFPMVRLEWRIHLERLPQEPRRVWGLWPRASLCPALQGPPIFEFA